MTAPDNPRNFLKRITQELLLRRHFIIYSAIGASGALLDYVTFVMMIHWLPWHYLAINSISTTLGVTNNFFLNLHYNFGVRDRIFRRFMMFFAVGLLGMGAASILLFLLIDVLQLIPAISKFLVIFVIVLLQYNLNKRISFKRTQS